MFTANKKQERPFLCCPYSHKNTPKKHANFAPYPNTKKEKKLIFAPFLSLPFFVNFFARFGKFYHMERAKKGKFLQLIFYWKILEIEERKAGKNWRENFGIKWKIFTGKFWKKMEKIYWKILEKIVRN